MKDKIKLVKPTKEWEEKALEFKQEHFENGEKKIHGCSLLDKLDSYDEWLQALSNNSKKETLRENWALSSTFFGVRQSDERIVGIIDIRHELTSDYLKNYAGNIGYGVRPTERRKGYATQMLEQALEFCKKELSLDKVVIGCHKENEGSRKTIINAGGILEKEYTTENGENIQKYSIKL